MSDESCLYYTTKSTTENTEWSDSEDLATLMHAAADADARDSEEALLKEQGPGTPAAGTKRKYSSEEINKDGIRPADKTTRHDFPGYYNKTDKPSASKRNLGDVVSVQTSTKRLKTNDGAYLQNEEAVGYARVVAEHYNTLEEKGLDERLKSRIFYMRNFNNWIKSMLINEYLNKVKKGLKHNSPIRVMDMGCGKGGDLLKWRKGNISNLICTDIATVSLEQCESRYNEMCARSSRERNANRIYKAEFIAADSTRVRLRERFSDPSIKLDIVSCQFVYHYSFESLPQAECMLRNAAECLQPGGFFIGTMPDANEIVARQRKANCRAFGNDVYQIVFQSNTSQPALFGVKYNFHLDGVVDCPEFLVHFPTFTRLARKHGLQLMRVERFVDYFARMKAEGGGLLQKMQGLETFPTDRNGKLLGTDSCDYKHAEKFLRDEELGRDGKVGTLSKSEWEATSLYLTFAFQKVKSTWDANGKPKYEFS